MNSLVVVALLVGLTADTSPTAGSISGVVVNASDNDQPVPGAEIVLRVRVDGQFVIAAEGLADQQGRFVFDNIPADTDYIYLPGANHAGVHYPGSRIRLDSQLPHARIDLSVHNTVTGPSPLVLRHHHVSIHPEASAIRVTERLLIENPTLETYVGDSQQEGRAATLRLAIPSNFRRTTFTQEFYGRQFTLFQGKLVTDIPWTPGKRELELTYVLPRDDQSQGWQRPLDLPCESLRIEVHTQTPDRIACDLPPAAVDVEGVVAFESKGQELPANQVIHVQLDRVPFSLARQGRWLALAVLVGLITCVALLRRPRPGSQVEAEADSRGSTMRKRAA